MKRILTTITICIVICTWTMSQDNKQVSQNNGDIILKGDYILINKKCKTTYRNFTSEKELVEIEKVLLKRNSILSVVVFNKSIFITTSELCWMTGSNANKNYSFDFLDSDSLITFLSKLTESLAGD
jgi:hypothetical protein